MTQRIKYHFLQNLFRLFSALADKTGGWSLFVRPKLLIGSLIISSTIFAQQTISIKKEDSTKKRATKEGIQPNRKRIKHKKRHAKRHKYEILSNTISCYMITEPVPLPVPQEIQPLEDPVINVIPTQPNFPGGMAVLYNYLNKNIVYPPSAREAGVEGKVIISFVVGKKGQISEVQVLKSLDPACDEEAVKLVKNMLAWIPGKQGDIPVKVKMTLPIVFKLPENDTTH